MRRPLWRRHCNLPFIDVVVCRCIIRYELDLNYHLDLINLQSRQFINLLPGISETLKNFQIVQHWKIHHTFMSLTYFVNAFTIFSISIRFINCDIGIPLLKTINCYYSKMSNEHNVKDLINPSLCQWHQNIVLGSFLF